MTARENFPMVHVCVGGGRHTVILRFNYYEYFFVCTFLYETVVAIPIALI